MDYIEKFNLIYDIFRKTNEDELNSYDQKYYDLFKKNPNDLKIHDLLHIEKEKLILHI